MSNSRKPEKSALEFNDLPEELVLEIISNMLPEEILAQKSVSRNFYRLASDQLLWKRMMQIHFPHQIKNQKQNIDWPVIFKESYLEEYRNIPKNKRFLFSMAKQGRVVPLTKIKMEDLDLEDTNGNFPAVWAAMKKNQTVLNYFFTVLVLPYYQKNKITQYNKQDPKGRSILFQAAKYNQINLVNLSLRNGANINKANYKGATPLFVAAQNGNFEVVTSLLAAGADVNQAVNDGATPLFVAAHNDHLEIVKILLAAGADVNQAVNDGPTPLFIAAQNSYLEIVTALLAAGANVNQAAGSGETPLFVAARWGDIEIVTTLLIAGADVNQATGGATALYTAAQYDHLEIVTILLFAGADVNQAAFEGSTPLHIAIQKCNLEIVTALLATGANINQARNDGATSLHIATQFGHFEIVTKLLTAGADVNAAAHNGATPLHVAALEGHLAIATTLLAARANVNQTRIDGVTPLFLAAKNAHRGIVIALLAAGANINQARNDGATPLYIAVAEGHPKTVQALLNANADIQYNDYGLRLLELAHQKIFSDIVIALLKPFVLNYILRNLEKNTQHSFKLFYIGPTIKYGPNPHQFSQAAKALFDVLEGFAKPETLKPHYEVINHFESLHKDELVTLFNYFYQHFPSSTFAAKPIESAAAPLNQSLTR